MRKFAKIHKKLFGIGCVSFIIVISYAVTYNMPDYFGIEGWYSLANNLSISYLAALVFYVLQVYLPQLDKSRRASMTLKPLFIDLVKFIEISIECCRKYVEIDENGKINIKWSDPKEKKISFVVGEAADSKITGRFPIIKTDKELRNIKQVYEYKISTIKNRIDFKDCDEHVLVLFAELESSVFYDSTIPSLITLEGTFTKFNDFERKMSELETLKNKFKKSCEIDIAFAIREANEAELFAYNLAINKDALKVGTAKEFVENTFKALYDEKLMELVPNETERKKILDELYSRLAVKDK